MENAASGAACYALMPDQLKQGVPSHWGTYVAVASVDEAMVKAKTLGGTVLADPMDVAEHGRMAVLRDSHEPGKGPPVVSADEFHAELGNSWRRYCVDNESYVVLSAKLRRCVAAETGPSPCGPSKVSTTSS